jgi:hypothetical protein
MFKGSPDPKVSLSPSLNKHFFPTINDYYLDMHHLHINFFYPPQAFSSPTKSEKTLFPMHLWSKPPKPLKKAAPKSPNKSLKAKDKTPIKSPKSQKITFTKRTISTVRKQFTNYSWIIN